MVRVRRYSELSYYYLCRCCFNEETIDNGVQFSETRTFYGPDTTFDPPQGFYCDRCGVEVTEGREDDQ